MASSLRPETEDSGDSMESDELSQVHDSPSCQSVMFYLPEVTHHILKHLPMRSLNTSARVCLTWSKLVRNIKKKRRQKTWITHDANDGQRNYTPVDAVDVELSNFIKNMSSEPEVAILFCTASMVEKPLRIPNDLSNSLHDNQRKSRSKFKSVVITDYIKQSLPESCQTVGVITDGIIGSSTNMSVTAELESVPAFSCLCLPKLVGLEVYPFGVSGFLEPETPFEFNNVTRGDLYNISGVPPGKDIKAVMLFITEDFFYSSLELGPCFKKCFSDTVVCGGYVDDYISCPNSHNVPADWQDREPVSLGIAFCGENVRCASVVVERTVKTKAALEKRIQKLKDCKFPEKDSFAFMFACIGRGFHHYNIANLEADVFRKAFPNTPLFGCFGNGEVGFDHLPGVPVEKSRKMYNKGPNIPSMYHTYATVFCLITVDKDK